MKDLGRDMLFFGAFVGWAILLGMLSWLTVGCTPSDDITFQEAASCGDSICIDASGSATTVNEVYGGPPCEQGNGVGMDISACCPEGFEAVGYCDVDEHKVACVRECGES